MSTSIVFSLGFMVLRPLFIENVYSPSLGKSFGVFEIIHFEFFQKMRILNFLIVKFLIVIGSEDFKVALIQTPPKR